MGPGERGVGPAAEPAQPTGQRICPPPDGCSRESPLPSQSNFFGRLFRAYVDDEFTAGPASNEPELRAGRWPRRPLGLAAVPELVSGRGFPLIGVPLQHGRDWLLLLTKALYGTRPWHRGEFLLKDQRIKIYGWIKRFRRLSARPRTWNMPTSYWIFSNEAGAEPGHRALRAEANTGATGPTSTGASGPRRPGGTDYRHMTAGGWFSHQLCCGRQQTCAVLDPTEHYFNLVHSPAQLRSSYHHRRALDRHARTSRRSLPLDN